VEELLDTGEMAATLRFSFAVSEPVSKIGLKGIL
jgi:hypothetical protein